MTGAIMARRIVLGLSLAFLAASIPPLRIAILDWLDASISSPGRAATTSADELE